MRRPLIALLALAAFGATAFGSVPPPVPSDPDPFPLGACVQLAPLGPGYKCVLIDPAPAAGL